MGNEIKIVIGGDPSGFTKAAKDVTTSTDRMRKSLQDAAGAFPTLSRTSSGLDPSLEKVKNKSNAAGAAVLDFSRIVQDAPYAANNFGSIANNIDPAFQSFNRLSEEAARLTAETGKTVTAFQLLGQSILGGAGLGLLISLITSGITAFQMFSRETENANKEADDLAKTIRSFSLIENEAAASIDSQITTVNALATAVSDANTPYIERKRALDELKSINKAYFNDLTLEDAATGKLTNTVKQYTDALIQSAIQKQYADEIGNVAKAVADADDEIAKSRSKLKAAQEATNKALGASADFLRQQESKRPVSNRLTILRKEAEAEEDLRKANAKATDLLVQRALLTDKLNKSVEAGLKFKSLDADTKKEEDALKKRIDALKQLQSASGLDAGQQVLLAQLEIQLVNRDAVKLGFTKAEAQQQIQGILEKAFPVDTFEFETVVTTRVNKLETSKIQKPKPLTEDQKIDIAKAIGLETIEIPAPNLVFLNIADKAKAGLEQLNKAIDSIAKGFMETFAESVGNAIAGQGDIFSSLFTILADGLIQLGKALLAFGLALVGFKAAIKSLNPVVAIAAGAAAVVAGTALKASLPKFAEGGIATRATMGIFGEAGKEAIIPLDKLPELLGRINVNNQNDIALAPTFRVSLTDLELGLERVRSKRRRLG